MIITGIILIVLGIIGFISVRRLTEPISVLILSLAISACILLGIAFCVAPKVQKVQKEYKYPSSEYRLDYEITTRGEQVDTVYVLIKK